MGYETEQLSDDELIVRGLVIEDASAKFVEYLSAFKFENVQLTELATDDIPSYAMDWLGEGFSEEELRAAMSEVGAPRYWIVSSTQGMFGLFYAGYPLIDVTGTGIELSEIVTDYEELDPQFPFFALGGDEVLRRFCALLSLQHDFIVSEQENE